MERHGLFQRGFMRSRWKTYLLYASLIIFGASLLFILIETVRAKNTGFETKTLWDWMELLIIPFVLAVGAFVLNRSERAIERENANKRAELEHEIAKDRQQESAMQNYLDRMSDLLIDKRLQNNDTESEVRRFAKIRTITILRIVDLERKNLVIGFLRDANLTTGKNSIFNSINIERLNLSNVNFSRVSFETADLQKVNFQGAQLFGANLSMADLSEANLEKARLFKAVLVDANLVGAKLHEAFLYKADLNGASLQTSDLRETNLRGANLMNANLKDTNLEGADLREAKVTAEQLALAKSLKGATMPDGTIHE